MVSLPDALANPRAVVVHLANALPASGAVVRPIEFVYATQIANSPLNERNAVPSGYGIVVLPLDIWNCRKNSFPHAYIVNNSPHFIDIVQNPARMNGAGAKKRCVQQKQEDQE